MGLLPRPTESEAQGAGQEICVLTEPLDDSAACQNWRTSDQ